MNIDYLSQDEGNFYAEQIENKLGELMDNQILLSDLDQEIFMVLENVSLQDYFDEYEIRFNGIVWNNKLKTFYKNGLIHNEKGPAIISHDSKIKSFFWKNKEISKQDWFDNLNPEQKLNYQWNSKDWIPNEN